MVSHHSPIWLITGTISEGSAIRRPWCDIRSDSLHNPEIEDFR